MRIRAVRVRNVGRFVAPTAVERLSGGLDILAEGNEFGKSTLFRAIEAVFQVKHTATGAAVDRLRPYGGGDPLIEADFETDGRALRIRKQFGRGKGAELFDVATARTLARGAEAEDELARLIGVADGRSGRLGLLWVGQRRSLDPADPDHGRDRGERDALQSAIEREIETVASGEEARRVRARVGQRLDQLAGGRLVAGGQKLPKAGSPFEQALRERARISAELAEACAARDEAAERTARLERLLAQQSDYSDAAMTGRREAAAAARAAHEAAQLARLRHDRAAAARSGVAAEAREHARALSDFDGRLAALSRIDEAAGRSGHELRETETAVEHARDRVRLAEEAVAVIAADERTLRASLEAHDDAERRLAIAERLERMSRAHAAAMRLEQEIAAAAAQLAANRVTAQSMRAIEIAEREAARLGDRLAAAAPSVEIALVPGAGGRLSVDGKPLAADGSFQAREPLRIAIDGVGTITVSPGASTDFDETTRGLDAARATLAAELARSGVASVAEAASRRDERAALERAIEVSRQALAHVAPTGSASLGVEVEALRGQHAAMAEGALLPDRPAVTHRLEAVGHRRAAAAQELDEARHAAQRASEALAIVKARLGELSRQRLEIESGLPPELARAAERTRLQAASEAAARRADEAARTASALGEDVPSDARLAELAGAAAAAEGALGAATKAAQRLALEIRDLEARLDEAGEAGALTRAGALAGALELAESVVARFEAEKRALHLLDEALRQAESDMRDRFARPVSERLEPYLELLFPNSALRFGDGFKATELVREGLGEGIQALSDGTREQIAILVRLAFAQLLAETGNPAPVILDDALIYADDERIGRMFTALERASGIHQVLVLTCRAQLFTRLGGNRVMAERWDGAG